MKTLLTNVFALVALVATVQVAHADWDHERMDEGHGRPEVVRCESMNYQPAECARPFGRLLDVQQISSGRGACIEGRTYGVTERRIWVSGGCRADFVFERHHEEHRTRVTEIKCESLNYNPGRCFVGAEVVRVLAVEQISTSTGRGGACIEGDTYRVRGNEVRVFNGCRAIFRLEVLR